MGCGEWGGMCVSNSLLCFRTSVSVIFVVPVIFSLPSTTMSLDVAPLGVLPGDSKTGKSRWTFDLKEREERSKDRWELPSLVYDGGGSSREVDKVM